MKQETSSMEKTRRESVEGKIINLARLPEYDEVKTGDMFEGLFLGPKAVVIGLVRGIPGIEGVDCGDCRLDLLGYSPLLYFETRGLAERGLAGLSKERWRDEMKGNFRYFEESRYFERLKPIEMLRRAKDYLDSGIPIYSCDKQRQFLEKHRLEISRALGNYLENSSNNNCNEAYYNFSK